MGTPLENCFWTFLHFYCFCILFLLSYVNKYMFLFNKISVEIIISTKLKEVCGWKSIAFNDVIFLKSLTKAVEYNCLSKIHYIVLGLNDILWKNKKLILITYFLSISIETNAFFLISSIYEISPLQATLICRKKFSK